MSQSQSQPQPTSDIKYRYRLVDFKDKMSSEPVRTLIAVAGISHLVEEVTIEHGCMDAMPGTPGADLVKKALQSYPFGKLPMFEVLGEGIQITDYAIGQFIGEEYGLSGSTHTHSALCTAIAYNVNELARGFCDESETDMEVMNKKIAKYRVGAFLEGLAKLEKYVAVHAGAKTGFLVADQLTWADVSVASFFDECSLWDPSLLPEVATKFPTLHAYLAKVNGEQRVHEYKSKRTFGLPPEGQAWVETQAKLAAGPGTDAVDGVAAK